MGLAVLVQCWKHYWQDDGGVVADEGHDVLVVPVVQRPLSNLRNLELNLRYSYAIFHILPMTYYLV